MGWVDWGVLPCENFYKWACHGRATDAPEMIFMHSGDDGAMFAATESLRKAILQRNIFEASGARE
ncbi:hypothetical protein IscW_ISCW013950 [Ixodes scapularis]|uniref:Uncharacterized protein n=1 Tax=Ixodes scapularis TaxID=6945 RepID=B7QLT4_IXOSC|nr:hypothetical protein IscW_ISCW013950 [Ixodes scapularis]|eukprot:XP_002416139.1 hypothetical protein IscW_ISCW013950 [Ixodes scapularis]